MKQIADALTRSGAVKWCPIHTTERKPCQICDRAFSHAQRQRTGQNISETKQLHLEWLRDKRQTRREPVQA